MKKYKLTDTTIQRFGKTLRRIQALKSFSNVKADDLGGFVESEANLAQDYDAWVYGDAVVCDEARVFHNAKVRDEAIVKGKSQIYNSAIVQNRALVAGNACVFDRALVGGYAFVTGSSRIWEESKVSGQAQICGNAMIREQADIRGQARISGRVQICGTSKIFDVNIGGKAVIYGNANIRDRNDYCAFEYLGPNNDSFYAYRTSDDDVLIVCDLFRGNMSDFIDFYEKLDYDEMKTCELIKDMIVHKFFL